MRIVEISWYRNDSFGDFLAKEGFGVGFDFGKHHGGNFLWCVFFAVHFYGDTIALLDNFVRANFEVTLNFVILELAPD